jgi:hypothetical protein
MACSTGYMYDTQEEVLPACEQNDSDDSDDSDDYKDIDEWDGLEATDSASLVDKAEDDLLPPDVSKCSAALSGMPTREANLLASEYRDVFAEGEGDKIDSRNASIIGLLRYLFASFWSE